MEEGREVHIPAVLAEGYQRSRRDAQGGEKSCVAGEALELNSEGQVVDLQVWV